MQILLAGRVTEVLAFAERRWAGGADPSLVRYFVFGVLAAAGPPYSSAFASSLLRCVLGSGSAVSLCLHVVGHCLRIYLQRNVCSHGCCVLGSTTCR